MSDSDSSSSSSITDDYDLEVENNQLNSVNNVRERDDDSFEVVVPYADEPIADEEWIVRFEEERQREDEIQFLMQQRLHQEVPVNSWYVNDRTTCELFSLFYLWAMSFCFRLLAFYLGHHGYISSILSSASIISPSPSYNFLLSIGVNVGYVM